MMRDFEYLTALPGTVQEQAWVRERLDTLSVREGIALTAATAWHPPETLADAIKHLQALDSCDVYFPAGSYAQLGELYMRRETRIPEDAFPYVDLSQLGRQYEDANPGLFVGNCYAEYHCSSAPSYDGSHLPEDGGWSVKLKLSSPAVPEGVWMRLPGYDGSAFLDSDEILLALHELEAESLEDCTLLEARCILPEAGDLMAQYGSITELVRDGNNLGLILDEQGEGAPDFTNRFAAALELEDCRTLRFALDIAQNLHCYDWISSKNLESHAVSCLLAHGVEANLIQSGVIDLKHYAEDLLETSGYMAVSGDAGYARRNGEKFSYEFSAPEQTVSQGVTEAGREGLTMGGM